MSSFSIGVAHALTGALGVSFGLPLWFFITRWVSVQNRVCWWVGNAVFFAAMGAIIASFVLGFVFVAPSGMHLSLTTPSRGAHAITGLVLTSFCVMLLVIRIAVFPRDVREERQKSTYLVYLQVTILIILLGFVCVYCSFVDYAYVVTWMWFPIYGGYIGFLFVLLVVGEIVMRARKSQSAKT